MSKLPKEYKFIDVSDYGRSSARFIANFFINTSLSPVQMTGMFIVAGILAIASILYFEFWAAALFLILKSILDAADGELARLKKTPSYTGRYFDSIADIILNFFILLSIWYISDVHLIFLPLAFVSMQLQGTLYNYYYVILRNKLAGDTTSRVFEIKAPKALKGEKQETVNILFTIYKILYGVFDKTIYILDPRAVKSKPFPNWFMSMVSIFGLGFQLLLIGLLLVLGLKDLILYFFIGYSVFIIIFIGLRKWMSRRLLKKEVS